MSQGIDKTSDNKHHMTIIYCVALHSLTGIQSVQHDEIQFSYLANVPVGMAKEAVEQEQHQKHPMQTTTMRLLIL